MLGFLVKVNIFFFTIQFLYGYPNCISRGTFYVEETVKIKNLFTTGDYTPSSGQYEIVGPRGGKFEGREITTMVDSTMHVSDVKRK